jgi:membrane fusion protein, multidrug efflux system
MKRIGFGALAVIGVVGALASAAWAGDGAGFKVALTTVEDHKAVFATVESIDVVDARTRIGGTISTLDVDEGSLVAKGQILARVEDPKLRLRMAGLEARIKSLRSQRALARTSLKRAAGLRKSGVASQARLDQAQTSLEVVSRDLDAMVLERQVISQQRQEGVVLAPAEGRVLKVHVTNASVVLPGESVATIAAEAYILRLRIPERHARFIGKGDAVQVDRRGQALATGTVRQVYPQMNKGRVIADVDVAGLGDFFVGERIRVYVGTGQRRTFVVPENLVYRRHGLAFVNVEGVGEVVVQPGAQLAEGLEILSGLGEGDVLSAPKVAK